MSHTEQMREAFEAWAPPAFSRDKIADHDGDSIYCDDWMQGAWVAFQELKQAALTAPAAEVPAQIERKVYVSAPEYREYLRARFSEQHRSELSFEWDGHRWAYRFTTFDDAGEYHLLWRPAPDATAAEPKPLPSALKEKLRSAEAYIATLEAESTRLRGGVPSVPEAYTKAMDALLDFAQTVGGSSSFWDDVWPEHEAAMIATAAQQGADHG